MNVKIMVAHHKKYHTFSSDIFMPVQVGKEKARTSLNMQGDNEGDNISGKNNIYCELTATYWGWKNLEDADYLGVCHYRRYFSFGDISYFSRFKRQLKRIFLAVNIKNEMVLKSGLDVDEKLTEFESKLQKDIQVNDVEVYALRPALIHSIDVKTFFYKPAGHYPIDLLKEIVDREFSSYSVDIQAVLSGNRLYYGNMVLMKKNLFNEYAKFLFHVLKEHEIESVKRNWCSSSVNDGCYSRLSGYLGELLTSCFIEKSIRDGRNVKLLNSYMLDL